MKKKNLLLFIILLNSIMGFSQIGKYDKSSYATYTPLTPSEIFAPAAAMNQRYESNAARVDAMIEGIFELKKQTNDPEFLKAMDKHYQKLKGFYKMNLAAMSNEIREVRFAILEDIDKYDKRMKNQTTVVKQKDISNLSGYQTVYKHSPIIDRPDIVNGKDLGRADDGIVVILEKYDDNFYKVKVGEVIGYIWNGWFR